MKWFHSESEAHLAELNLMQIGLLPFCFLLTLDKQASIEFHLATIEDIISLLSLYEEDCHSKIIECTRLMSPADGHVLWLNP